MADSRYKNLKKSIQQGDSLDLFIKKLDQAFKDGFRINEVDRYRSASATPIVFVAAKYSRMDIVKELLERGAEINRESTGRSDAPTILTYLLSLHGMDEKFMQEILDLVENKVKFNQRFNGKSALDLAIKNYPDTAALLLDKYREKFSETKKIEGLFTAVSLGNISVVKELLRQIPHGITAVRFNNDTLLHIAATTCRSTKMIELLLECGVEINSRNLRGESPLQKAAETGNQAIFDYMKDKGADIHNVDIYGGTVLTSAITGGNLNIINSLLEAGANPNVGRGEKKTAIYYAISSRVNTVPEQLAIIRSLINAGAELNIVDGKKYTPLMQTIKQRKIAPLKLLLESGADVNYVAPSGATALSYLFTTASTRNFLEKAFELLLKHGADINVTGKEDTSLLNMYLSIAAFHSPKVLKGLIDAGADVNDLDPKPPLITALSHESPLEEIRMLLDAGADPNKTDEQNNCSLHWAAYMGSNYPESDPEFIKALLPHIKDVNRKGRHGKTALGILCDGYIKIEEIYTASPNRSYVDYLKDLKEAILIKIKILLEAGATLEADPVWCKPQKWTNVPKEKAYNELMLKISQFENAIKQLSTDKFEFLFDYEL